MMRSMFLVVALAALVGVQGALGQRKEDAPEKTPIKTYAKWSFLADDKGKRQIPFEGFAYEAGKEPIKVQRGLEYRLILTPKRDFIWLVAAFQTQRPGEFPDVLRDTEATAGKQKFFEKLDAQALKLSEFVFEGGDGLNGSVSAEGAKTTFSSLFVLKLTANKDAKLGSRKVRIAYPVRLPEEMQMSDKKLGIEIPIEIVATKKAP